MQPFYSVYSVQKQKAKFLQFWVKAIDGHM